MFFPRAREQDEDDVNTVVQPDLLVVCDTEKLRERGIWGAPDLAVEILSPSTCRKDQREKFDLYQRSGVKEYWVIDPAGRWVQQYSLQADGTFVFEVTFERTGHLESTALPGLIIEIGELWS